MTDHAPNLVERAAARLRQPAAKIGSSAPSLRAEALAPPSAPHPPSEAVDSGVLARALRPTALDRPLKSVVITPAKLAANGIIVPSADLSRTVQEFRALKRELLSSLKRQNTRNRIVLVTSAGAAEGKTFTATNLAMALAYEKESRVLLMDADAYRPSLMQYLGTTAEDGWLDVVTGRLSLSDVLLRTTLPNLDLLPCGKAREGIPELMSSSHMGGLFDELVRQEPSRTIIVDSVPCLTSTEPSILAGVAAQTLLVVAAHETARDRIEASLRVLEASPSISLVLNKAHSSLTEQFKGYGYYGSR